MNGWVIAFVGQAKSILMGWYKNNSREGNWMHLNADDMSIKVSGWYEKNVRTGPLQNHWHWKKFSVKDIFLHPQQIDTLIDRSKLKDSKSEENK